MHYLIKRAPVLSFFAFVFIPELIIFILVFSSIVDLPPIILILVGSWLPNLAGILITGLTGGRSGLVKLFSALTRWKFSLRWYAVAILGPAGIILLAAGLISGANLSVIGIAPLSSWAALAFGGLILGPLGEELGWRGTALPNLLKRLPPLAASLVLGTVWGAFHVPTFFIAGTPQTQALILPFMIMSLSLTIFMTWLYLHTLGSLVPIIFSHFAVNFSLNVLGLPANTAHQWVLAGLMAVGASALVFAGGLKQSTNPNYQALPPNGAARIPGKSSLTPTHLEGTPWNNP